MRHATSFGIALMVFAVLMLPGRAGAQTSCGVPDGRPRGWDVAAPEQVGLAPGVLCQMARRFADWPEADVHAILIARHGKLVFEQYYSGPDAHWGEPSSTVDFGPTVPHDLRSITKSVVGLLVGIGIEKGWVRDLDQPVLSLLPAYADLRTPDKDKITLRDLLTMTSGLAWNEDLPYGDPRNSETSMDGAPDPCRFVLEQPISFPAGAVWTYSGGATALIACVLHAATGHTIDALADETLFKPLGIESAEWVRYPKTGEPVAASGLRMLPSDTLKIGQLVLDKGVWHGNEVVPAAWVGEAVSPQVNGRGSLFYGFQFWLGRSLVDRREIDWVAGIGYGGQRLFIVPSLDLVVLVHAGLYASPVQDWVGTVILNRFVLPAAAP